jgi:hypothetical protein
VARLVFWTDNEAISCLDRAQDFRLALDPLCGDFTILQGKREWLSFEHLTSADPASSRDSLPRLTGLYTLKNRNPSLLLETTNWLLPVPLAEE